MDRIQFTEAEHSLLATLFDDKTYKGYKPEQAEAPNSDGRVDIGKRYLHVAPKYNPPLFAVDLLAMAHYEALRIAEEIGVPDAFYPRVENSTLRVLEYPAGTGTLEHTDFDLFTVNLWRSTPDDHEQFGPVNDTDCDWTPGVRSFHMGRIGAMLGMGTAVPHRVPARDYPQKALVYFAMPANAAVFPYGSVDRHGDQLGRWDGETVASWLASVYAASRVSAPKY